MTFAFRIFFECIRYGNRSIAQILTIHRVHGCIGCLETSEIDECKTFRISRLRISHYFRRLQNHTECRECVVQQFLVHFGIQVANEYVRADVQVLLMGRRFVHTNRFAIQFYHVHDFYRIVGVIFAEEFHKTVALVHLRDTILWHVDVH